MPEKHCNKCSYETDEGLTVKLPDPMPLSNIMDIEPVIMLSKWCIKCYPKKIQAEFTFQGNSLCKECFEKSALLK